MRVWYDDDIDLLRRLYLSKFPIKLIARKLGRTVTATNKALTRFDIRPYLRSRKNTELSLTCFQVEQEHYVQEMHLFDYARKVLKWNIQSLGINEFCVNGNKMTFGQMLYKINILRMKKNEPILKIEENLKKY